MKVTKFKQSCLLVEMAEPVNRTALFDPGTMSEDVLDIDTLTYLDDIIITHEHADHFSIPFIKRLVMKFPEVHITGTKSVVEALAQEGITAVNTPSAGIVFFDSPHENVEPLFPTPEQIGVHYLNLLTHPGDSHSFKETKAVLALPVTAPWGATVKAVALALELKPQYVVPIHDWHWSAQAQEQMYDGFEKLFAKHSIQFVGLQTGEPKVLEV